MSDLSHTRDHRHCPACNAANLEVLAEVDGERLTMRQLSTVRSLAAQLGIRPTEVITRALRAYIKKLKS